MTQFTTEWYQKQLQRYENKSHPARIPDPKPRECPAPLEGHREEEARGSRCPVVRFRLCRVKLLDVDAKYASVKDLLDGLTAAGCIHGDKEGQIRLEVEQIKVSSYTSECTEIEIEYADSPALPK